MTDRSLGSARHGGPLGGGKGQRGGMNRRLAPCRSLRRFDVPGERPTRGPARSIRLPAFRRCRLDCTGINGRWLGALLGLIGSALSSGPPYYMRPKREIVKGPRHVSEWSPESTERGRRPHTHAFGVENGVMASSAWSHWNSSCVSGLRPNCSSAMGLRMS